MEELGQNVPKNISVIWQYGLWSFSSGDTKLERFLPKIDTCPKEVIEFWINGELSNRGHHFSNLVI